MLNLRAFMFERVYLAADAQREKPRVERMLHTLFDHYVGVLPPPAVDGASDRERVVDWLAGMTDRFAIRAPSQSSQCRRGRPGGAVHQGHDRPGAEAGHGAARRRAKTDLRRVGSRWTGLCLFHDERTPSFFGEPRGEALPLLRLRRGR